MPTKPRPAHTARLIAQAHALSQVGCWVYDLVHDRVEWTAPLFEVFGLPVGDVPPYEEHHRLFTEESFARLDPAVKAAAEHGHSYRLLLRAIRTDGAERWTLAMGHVERGADGTVTHLYGTFQDVHELVETQRERSTLKRQLSVATRASGVGIWDWNIDTGALVWDEEMHAIYAMPRSASLTFATWRDALHEDDRDATVAAVQRAVDGGGGLDESFRIRTAIGVRKIRAVADIVIDEHFGHRHMVGASWDVTDDWQREVQLSRQRDELARSNQALEQFAYAASHDLQEPLRAVTVCAQLLSRRFGDDLDDDAKELISHIVGGADRMTALIRDLLAFSRAGRGSGPQIAMSLTGLLDEAWGRVAQAALDTQATITVRDDHQLVMVGQRSELISLFQNLFSNALKYRSEEAPEITVRTSRHPTGARVEIEDNGIGIPSRHRERVFELFQRLHSRDEVPGTGIGLALCRRIAEHYGGRIFVESGHVGGTRVVLEWPS